MSKHVITDMEVKAREVLEKLILVNDFSCGMVCVRNVMRAMWSASLPVAKIEALSLLMNGQGSDLQKDCTAMVKAGILRSRVISGTRHNEINF